MRKVGWVVVPLLLLVGSCGGGGGGDTGGTFFLIEFLESGTNAIPRNRTLRFRFSAPVAVGQDFFERLKITNVGPPNFSLAIGSYVITGDDVIFMPRLPESPDRADAGFKADAGYHVFLKGGADALRSVGGDPIARPQEFLFDTSEFFEDPLPTEPPRALKLLARDPTNDQSVDLSRLEPRPQDLALLDSNDLLQEGRAIEPGAGGAPNYGTPWAFELHMSEPLDPATVTTEMVQLLEIRDDALTGATTADPGHVGDPVTYKVPILVEMVQRPDAAGELQIFIRVRAVQTLVDDARYRLIFSGGILGLDYRKTYIGENGLTGDGALIDEPGGLGYTAEFLVYDRPAITASRTVTYEPLADGIEPEIGQTTTDPALYNAALYNPSFAPGTAVGKVSDFGDGGDGNLSASGGGTVTIDTGDTPNPLSGISVTVTDLDYTDSYSNQGMPASGQRTVNGREPTVLQLENLTVSSGSTLRIIGVNPCRMLVRGQVQVAGTLDAGGSAGQDGALKISQPGAGGPGGFAGGKSPKGDKSCPLYGGNNCATYDGFLNICAGAKANFPFARKGEGPGRGNQGGDSHPYWAQLNSGGNVGARDNTATGGGGGSHGASGLPGEDRINAGGSIGTAGPSCSSQGTPNSSVMGVRGMPGPVYGDRMAQDWMGGSGGGGGGSVGEHSGAIGAYGTSGGSGGGGGGFFEIVSAGTIQITSGGRISVAGGQGGAGYLELNVSPQYGNTYQTSWNTVSGGGGGGAGGTISLVSGGDVSVIGGILDARGGAGGLRGTNALQPNVNGCNGGGEGGKGFLFVMDVDGSISGLGGGVIAEGQYDTFAYGVLTVSRFDLDRFGGISAITEMFGMPAADPDYQPMDELDVVANVNLGQRIRIYASSAKANPDDPLLPNVATETGLFEIAVVQFAAGAATVDITGDMENLNPAGGLPDRDAFTRVYAGFEYDKEIDAAIGPFASVDEVTVRCSFNG
jgi:hypothetical protein